MNTTTNTYKATQEMMDSFDDNYVAYLGQNPFSMLVLISDGEHRDTYRRNKVSPSSLTIEKSLESCRRAEKEVRHYPACDNERNFHLQR